MRVQEIINSSHAKIPTENPASFVGSDEQEAYISPTTALLPTAIKATLILRHDVMSRTELLIKVAWWGSVSTHYVTNITTPPKVGQK